MAKNEKKITIKIEGKEWTDALDKAFTKKSKTVKVDGFRKGKVPKNIYLERFGIESLYMDAYEYVVDDAYHKALEENDITPAVQPSVDVTAIDENGVTFEFTFIGKPDVKLGKYKDLKIKKEDIKVSKEEIEDEIKHLREQFAEIRVKEDGKVEDGDTAIINFAGTVDGKALDGGTGENYPLEIGSHTFIPGFEEGVVGMSVGEEKDLHLKFPDDYVEDLKGKEVVFHVTLNEIKSRILPDIDEDFFKDLGYDKVTNETELKSEVEKVISERKEADRDDRFIEEVLKTASENMEVDVPEEIIDDEVHRMMEQFESQLKMQGLTIEQYMNFSGMTHEDFHKNMEPEATKRIKYRYLLEAVAEEEKIEVTEEDAMKDAEEMAENYGITKDELLEAFGGMDVLKYDSKMRKTLDFLKKVNA